MYSESSVEAAFPALGRVDPDHLDPHPPSIGQPSRFGRSLFYLDRDDALDVGLQMVRAGWATVFTDEVDFQRIDAYLEAEGTARGGAWRRCDGDFHRSRVEEQRDSAEHFIDRYYASVSNERFRAAWGMLSRRVRRGLGSFRTWKAGHRRSLGVSLLANSARLSAGRAVVNVRLRSRDRDACSGRIIRQTFGGSWVLAPRRGSWIAIKERIRKTGGGLVRRSKSECAPRRKPEPPPPAPPSDFPASFFTGPAGAENPLPAPGKAWFGESPHHLAEFRQREGQVGRQFSVIHDFQGSRCQLEMPRVNDYRAEGPLVLSWQPSPSRPDQVLAGQADICIRSVGAQLASITSGNPVILRMYHEWNGSWMPWSNNSNGSRITATQARDVFRRTVDQLRAGGAFANGKVATMLDWHEGSFGNGDVFDELQAYPGDNYVDWLGSTEYAWYSSQWCGPSTQHYCEFGELFHHGRCLTPPFPEQQQPGFSCNATNIPVGVEVWARGRKPYMVTETGRNEFSISLQGAWMRNAGRYISANMPGLYGVIYFDFDTRQLGETNYSSLETNQGKLQGFADWGALPRFN